MPPIQPETSTVMPHAAVNRSIAKIDVEDLEVCAGPCMPGAACPTVMGRVVIFDQSGAVAMEWDDMDIDLTLHEMHTKERFEVADHYFASYWYDGRVDLLVEHPTGGSEYTQSQDDYYAAVEAAMGVVEAWSEDQAQRTALQERRMDLSA